MGEFVNDTLIIVPVFVKEQDDDLVEKIRNLAEVGTIYVVNQGKRFEFEKLPHERGKFDQIEVLRIEKPVGIWRALEIAYWEITGTGGGICDHPFWNQLPKYVVLNLAPKLFGKDNVAKMVLDGKIKHVVGMRSNIAASLGSEKRALLECFFTTLAGIILGHGKSFSCDGFTGLQSMTIERYIQSDWGWIEPQRGKEPWGGALITQIQSFQNNRTLYLPVMINTETKRTWPSTLGDTEKKAVVNMLEKCRRLPIFAEVSLVNIGQALDQFVEDFKGLQLWLNPKTAKDEVLEMLRLGGWEE